MAEILGIPLILLGNVTMLISKGVESTPVDREKYDGILKFFDIFERSKLS